MPLFDHIVAFILVIESVVIRFTLKASAQAFGPAAHVSFGKKFATVDAGYEIDLDVRDASRNDQGGLG